METYGGDQFTQFIKYTGKNISWITEQPVFKKNDYGYNEFLINTDELELMGSSTSHKLLTAKYSSFFLDLNHTQMIANAIDVCKTIKNCTAVLDDDDTIYNYMTNYYLSIVDLNETQRHETLDSIDKMFTHT
jgi:hypothetical protein